MTKADLLTANQIFIHSCEMLIRQVAEYEAMVENCVIMPKEYYKEMIEDFHAMKRSLEDSQEEIKALKFDATFWRSGND